MDQKTKIHNSLRRDVDVIHEGKVQKFLSEKGEIVRKKLFNKQRGADDALRALLPSCSVNPGLLCQEELLPLPRNQLDRYQQHLNGHVRDEKLRKDQTLHTEIVDSPLVSIRMRLKQASWRL